MPLPLEELFFNPSAHADFCMPFEISHDLIMLGPMEFAEGTYRLPGGNWQVYIFTRCRRQAPRIVPSVWESGVMGLVFYVSRDANLNQHIIEKAIADYYGFTKWVTVGGPDSMVLR